VNINATPTNARNLEGSTHMKVQVDTREFEAAHAQKPRGFGLWFFTAVDAQGETLVAVKYTGTYSEARKVAMDHARTVEASRLVVGS
jgi:hypothetical protein